MHVNVAIVGGGIAGLSCAAFLAPRTKVAVLETEEALGYHTTGRSAAIYTECYGSEAIRRITVASKPYFLDREEPFMTPRGIVFIAALGHRDDVSQLYDDYSRLVPDVRALSAAEVTDLLPVIPQDMSEGGVLEPGCMDIDVHAVLSSYAATVRSHGSEIRTDEAALEIERTAGKWSIQTTRGSLTADVVVNAAGSWGDVVAERAGIIPLGLTPYKRCAFTFDPMQPARDWPMAIDSREQWYFKPEGPHLIGTAASEIPEGPGDARHDELDIARGIERINDATEFSIRSVKNQWAGLRTFTPDRIPAVGRDAGEESFFWLVGQGGYGIHTSPGMGQLAAGLILDGDVPPSLSDHGVTATMFDPVRLRG